MAKMSNGRLRMGLIITFSGVAAAAVLAWASATGSQVAINTGDIKETKTVIRMVREEQAAGFKHLEMVIKEGRK